MLGYHHGVRRQERRHQGCKARKQGLLIGIGRIQKDQAAGQMSEAGSSQEGVHAGAVHASPGPEATQVQVGLDGSGRSGVGFHKMGLTRTPGKGLQAQSAAAGVEIQHDGRIRPRQAEAGLKQ